ncbi:MAG: Maf family protein [Thermoguttaceae bacterium]|nr:Maf family protein [Thermoguttaceae bacterium]
MTRLVLASASPRRRQLLTDAGWTFEIELPDPGLEESFRPDRSAPKELVASLAHLKADNVAKRLVHTQEATIVLACDSIAVCRGETLGKPKDRNDACRMLRLLSGSRHEVHTGMCLIALPQFRLAQTVETSVLVMEPLTEERIGAYLDSGLWQGKAGAFGYQDGNDWLHLESGSPSNVVGLPLEAFDLLFRDLQNSLHTTF